MIHSEVNRFMALAPLMLPTLINDRKMESEISEDSAVLIFKLEEPFPIGYVMELLDDDLDLKLLYHAVNINSHHVCYFANPKDGNLMYKVNFQSLEQDYVHNIIVTIYESLDVWEEELEVDVKAHQKDFEFIKEMRPQELLSVFCKMNYED